MRLRYKWQASFKLTLPIQYRVKKDDNFQNEYEKYNFQPIIPNTETSSG